MKFNSNPDKLLFFIGIIIVGLIMIIVPMLAYNNFYMIIGIFIWLIISFLIIRNINIVIYIKSNSFIYFYKGKKIIIYFDEINYIKEISNYSNPLTCNKYYIISKNVNISKIEIQNRSFSKWLEKNKDKFKIIKISTID